MSRCPPNQSLLNFTLGGGAVAQQHPPPLGHQCCSFYCLPSYPYTHLDRPFGLQEVHAPRFLDNWHMKAARLSALCNGCLYTLQERALILLSIGCWVDPMATEGLNQLKNLYMCAHTHTHTQIPKIHLVVSTAKRKSWFKHIFYCLLL